MRVVVRAFARFREMAGEEATLELPEGSTLADLLEEVVSSHPGLKKALSGPDGPIGGRAMVLLNRRGADPSDVLEEGDEVAILPPFSGG
ncbi:MAG: MoaD family protein [Methanothrix sp.]|jgi:MoaD family protein|nr:MoaD family protein [Methanothrix sp.]OPX82209.1 MAG: Small archaeal modifier protein 1 [Methanosaeta sp. PtaB.Bin087]OPY56784.1 MAG: Small archaeal modifier protein 1 [Methanosaeta sp. PtaU1.Bin055]NLX37939.1 MoaD family protein [Methanothrix sp.]HNR57031.1 MoaD family protein [Methanothrix sp.]